MNVDNPRSDWPGVDPRFNSTWRSWYDDAPRPRHDAWRAESDDGEETPEKHTGPSGNGNRPAPALPTDRVEALRRWIADGGHNRPEVAEEVARRILDSGDI